MLSRGLIMAAGLTVAVAVGGCYSPGGALLPFSGQAIVYVSTEMKQPSVELIDLRSDDVIFRMDVPPGKQLVIYFVPGDGDDPALRPDLMQYDLQDAGTSTGRLQNSITVPAATARRIDVFYNQGTKYAEQPPQPELRTDEQANRPDWWTPEGGPMPERDKGVTNYDS